MMRMVFVLMVRSLQSRSIARGVPERVARGLLREAGGTGSTMSTITNTERSVEILNSLLRGELSAQQAHEKALALAGDMTAGEVAEIRRISAEHTRTAETLRTEIFRLGGAPAGSAGAWGAFARAFQSSANLLGTATAISSLREGEEHGLKEYRESLEVATGPTKMLLNEKLIPNQQKHIAALIAIGNRRRSA